MALTLTLQENERKTKAEAAVIAVFTKDAVLKHPFYKALPATNQRLVRAYLKKGFSAEPGEVDFVVFPSGKPSAIFLIGLGKQQEWTARRTMLFFRRLISIAASQKVESLAVDVALLCSEGSTSDETVRLAAENLLLAEYTFAKFKKQEKKGRTLKSVDLVIAADRGVTKALRTGKATAHYANIARDLANSPASSMTPTMFADEVKALGKKVDVKVRALGPKEMEKEKMGAILGVAKGSVEEPRFVIMEYSGAEKSKAPLVFVGKGVTFDSGGINLKPSQAMSDMHMDMSGGAAAVSAVAAIAELKLPVNVIALVPTVENMPSGSATKPGDVLVSRSGLTIEVADTDAEGRVILSDALDFAKQYKPALVVDLATLTGAAAVALGLHYIGLFTADEKLATELSDLGQASGDQLWRLPMTEEYDAEVKGSVGDVLNIGNAGAGGRYGGASHGAAFLKRFAGNGPWAHLDIAPTMTSTNGQFLAKGATGTGVRLLVRLAEQRAKSGKK